MTKDELKRKKKELAWHLELHLAVNGGNRSECKGLRDDFRREVRELEKAARESQSPEQQDKESRKREASKARKYGLTPDAFAAMVEGQGRRCAACRAPFGPLPGLEPCIDHDHATGAVRGILCRLCNTTLGHAHDNPEILRGLIRYLAKQQSG